MNNSQTDLFEGLNSAQKAAVQCTEGPSLIIAGAGSGKTRVLTCRVAHILEGDCRPGEVMALTFTKKAAGEMKERVARLVGERKARWIQMGTFHSIFIRFLREYADRLGYPEHFTIYDQTDSRSVIKQCIKELELDDKNYKPAVVQSAISRAKNDLLTVNGYRADVESMERDQAARRPRLADVYALYQQKCLAAGAMDFDDILLQMNILLKRFPDACQSIAGRFRYILVDEYQDTNRAQYLILRRLAEPHHNLCVVGDDSQSIYGFRGARIENILRFKQDYPEAKEFRLEQNYRSTQTIVEAANSLIAHNERRLQKKCFSQAGKGEPIGSRAAKEGKVHMESNTWAVISGAADREQGLSCMDAVDEWLYTPWGLMLNAPSFVTLDDSIGFVTRVYPGVKENGAVFSHPNPWAWVAECMLGRGSRAMKFYDALLPENQNDRMEIRQAEPYSYCQFIMGKDHTAFGRARHPFMTGSSGWAYYAATRYMLGIRPGFDGLTVDPCIPAEWDGFDAVRKWRGAEYRIRVDNPDHVEKGVRRITADGEPVDRIPVFGDGVHRIVVTLGNEEK